LADVIMRSIDVEKDLSIWTGVLGARISDWAGDAAYLRFDDAHHRIALFPATRPGVLAVEYAVEDVDLLMRNAYALRDLQVAIVHGPGRRPASGQLFLTFASPCDVLFSFVSEGTAIDIGHRPRQFPAGPAGLCTWGSECTIREFTDPGRTTDQSTHKSMRIC
jgi:2,3-dihydroxy-p-cumate/2,3-dihydroxybenzoate 3,4-dioxygenase